MAELYIKFLAKPWVPQWDVHPPSSEALLEMVIIEPRHHECFAGVLRNVSALLPHAALTIVHSLEKDRKSVV
jgi:hypothetical protein